MSPARAHPARVALAMLYVDLMKLPAHLRKVDWLGVEVDLELVLGGLGAVLILRWLMV